MNNEDMTLTIGQEVGTPARKVLVFRKMRERVPGDTYASWVAICHDEDALHPFVVWDVVARPEGWAAMNGDYCTTEDKARERFDKRTLGYL